MHSLLFKILATTVSFAVVAKTYWDFYFRHVKRKIMTATTVIGPDANIINPLNELSSKSRVEFNNSEENNTPIEM